MMAVIINGKTYWCPEGKYTKEGKIKPIICVGDCPETCPKLLSDRRVADRRQSDRRVDVASLPDIMDVLLKA